MLSQLFAAISIGPYTFNGFDTVVLVLLIISALYAFARGLVREIVSIAALLVSVIVTLIIYGQFRFAARDFVTPQWLADGALILGAGALSYFLAALLFAKVGKTIAGEEPGLIDRLLGGAFGILRGLILAALFVMVTTAGYRASTEAQEHRAELEAMGVYDQVIENMPREYRDQLESGPKELPDMYQDSSFYPLLERIGDVIRGLPFAEMRSYADRIRDGDLNGVIEETL